MKRTGSYSHSPLAVEYHSVSSTLILLLQYTVVTSSDRSNGRSYLALAKSEYDFTFRSTSPLRPGGVEK